ncbi:MAG: PHP domain-containing protein [Spirochaetales bacterium]|nr:PHP domain-containing protein [Spirochaetales bacterium]
MIDLHAHSAHSDGELSPTQLMETAAARGLSAIALTDHDVLSGLPEASARASSLNLRFVPGVELEINFNEGEFHLLGLDLRGDVSPLEKRLVGIREHRSRRNERIVEKMNEAGVGVTMTDIASLAKGEVISRLHFAAYLVHRGIAPSIPEAFSRYLGKGKPFYDPKLGLDLDEAIDLIHHAGGKAVVAHPLTLKLPWDVLIAFFRDRRGSGLDGIEAYHSDFPPDDCRRLEEFGRTADFIITAGSDFHGFRVPNRRLGYSSGGMEIGPEFLEGLD